MSSGALPPLPLPQGITSRYLDLTGNPSCGLRIHILESGPPNGPLILLFHGYPELAYTWRRVLPALGAAGFHAVAPDSRGYGRTTGWDAADLAQFTPAQLLLDNMAILSALEHDSAAVVVGHDFGCTAASACALARPDLFRSALFSSHVPSAPPPLRSTPPTATSLPRDPDVHANLLRRDPPLVHYQWYNSGAGAAHDWANPAQGMRSFLRGYVHLKSGAWARNSQGIGRLAGWTAPELARLPAYYAMPAETSMPDVVAAHMAGEDAGATADVVADAELDVYASEFARTGFQGMLNWYRASTAPASPTGLLALFKGRRFELPLRYLGGEADWGNYQRPGALEGLEEGRAAADYRGARIVPRVGHWPQTECPDVMVEEVLALARGVAS